MRRRRAGTRRRPARGDPERGMVTAEIATTLPALAVVLVAAVWVLAFGAAQVRCADAAREAARAAARGEDAAVVRQVATEVAPDGAVVDVERSARGAITVEVSTEVPMPGPAGGSLPSPSVLGRAVAWDEAG